VWDAAGHLASLAASGGCCLQFPIKYIMNIEHESTILYFLLIQFYNVGINSLVVTIIVFCFCCEIIQQMWLYSECSECM